MVQNRVASVAGVLTHSHRSIYNHILWWLKRLEFAQASKTFKKHFGQLNTSCFGMMFTFFSKVFGNIFGECKPLQPIQKGVTRAVSSQSRGAKGPDLPQSSLRGGAPRPVFQYFLIEFKTRNNNPQKNPPF